MRILVVDDDVRLCAVLLRGLTEEGYAVDVAHDGEEGQYLAEVHPYDLIVLDIMMPKADGRHRVPQPPRRREQRADPDAHGEGRRARSRDGPRLWG